VLKLKALLSNGIVIRFEATAGEPFKPLVRVILEAPRQVFSKKDTEKLQGHPDIVDVEFLEDIHNLISPGNDLYTVEIKINSLSMKIKDMMRRAADIISGILSV
jgi:hypothetical protein